MDKIKGVSDYRRIRRFLEHIYLYGFYSREDFERCGIGGKNDYDFGTGLLRALYPELDDTAVWDGGRKFLRFQREYARSSENRLADSYLLHSIKESSELPELLLILSSMAGGRRSLDDLFCTVELHCQTKDTSKYSTVRRRVQELIRFGYVRRNQNTCGMQCSVSTCV